MGINRKTTFSLAQDNNKICDYNTALDKHLNTLDRKYKNKCCETIITYYIMYVSHH